MSADTCIIIVSAALLFTISGEVRIVSHVLDCLPNWLSDDPRTFSVGA